MNHDPRAGQVVNLERVSSASLRRPQIMPSRSFANREVHRRVEGGGEDKGQIRDDVTVQTVAPVDVAVNVQY